MSNQFSNFPGLAKRSGAGNFPRPRQAKRGGQIKNSRPKAGFTLIEIIIGLTIISLLFLVGYASYQEFARRQALNVAYSKVKSSLELAQQLALSGEKPSVCTETLTGYQVSFYSARNYFDIDAVCNSSVRVKRISLPPGITVPQLAVFYNVLAKGTTFSSEQTFTFTQQSTGRTLIVVITPEGSLKRQ